MKFVVKFRSGDSPTTNRYPHAVLIQDNWDDYGYKTTFHVTLHMSADESYDLGNIKIIEAGRTSGYTEVPKRPFGALPAVPEALSILLVIRQGRSLPEGRHECGRQDSPAHAEDEQVAQRLDTRFTIEEADPVLIQGEEQPEPDGSADHQPNAFTSGCVHGGLRGDGMNGRRYDVPFHS